MYHKLFFFILYFICSFHNVQSSALSVIPFVSFHRYTGDVGESDRENLAMCLYKAKVASDVEKIQQQLFILTLSLALRVELEDLNTIGRVYEIGIIYYDPYAKSDIDTLKYFGSRNSNRNIVAMKNSKEGGFVPVFGRRREVIIEAEVPSSEVQAPKKKRSVYKFTKSETETILANPGIFKKLFRSVQFSDNNSIYSFNRYPAEELNSLDITVENINVAE